jgi:hypothetical protein
MNQNVNKSIVELVFKLKTISLEFFQSFL